MKKFIRAAYVIMGLICGVLGIEYYNRGGLEDHDILKDPTSLFLYGILLVIAWPILVLLIFLLDLSDLIFRKFKK